MQDTLKAPSALELRAEPEAMIQRDLLRPAGGPEEEITDLGLTADCYPRRAQDQAAGIARMPAPPTPLLERRPGR